MRIITLLLLLTISYISSAQTGSPFRDLKLDKVVFFDFEDVGEKGSLIVDNSGKYIQTIIKQVQLDTETVRKLNAKLVYYLLDGLSKSFRKYIKGLLQKHKFTHQIEPGSHFDE